MPLESCVLILDDSDWMRNGDFLPTRLSSQTEAVHQLANYKLDDNPESTIGVMSMANGGKVLVSLCRDFGDILTATNSMQPRGTADLLSALAIAQLMLKNRRNKEGSQRIIIFVGSPLEAKERDLVRVGKLLKRSAIAVDVVNFGEETANQQKLEAFIGSVRKSSRSCNLITIPSGSTTDLSTILISTPIFNPDGSGSGSTTTITAPSTALPAGGEDPELLEAIRQSLAASGGGDAVDEEASLGGLLGDDDPELQAALLMSQQPQETSDAPPAAAATTPATPAATTTTTAPAAATPAPSTPAATTTTTPSTPAPETPAPQEAPAEDSTVLEDDEDDPEAALQLAILMSQEIPQSTNTSAPSASGTSPAPSTPAPATPTSTSAPPSAQPATDDSFDHLIDDNPEDLDPELLAALQMSMESGASSSTPASTPSAPSTTSSSSPSPSPSSSSSSSSSTSSKPTATSAPSNSQIDAELLADPELREALTSVLGEIEGVDTNDPQIQAELDAITKKKPDSEK